MTGLGFQLLFSIWAAVLVAVVGLAIYRRTLSSHEDDSIHIRDTDSAAVVQQAVLTKKLDAVDRWGKILTVLAVVLGVVVIGMYTYSVWVASTTSPQVG